MAGLQLRNEPQTDAPEPRKVKDEKINHLWNSRGVMTSLGQANDLKAANPEVIRPGRKQNIETKRFFFESVDPINGANQPVDRSPAKTPQRKHIDISAYRKQETLKIH